ncbi:unnamed protein product [Spirodela intermedia]|uniref:Uncharacterized protein n=1 Tax=Spirodela intermedia TaxID=51605 RepID=A0A7I8IXC3_SPIIN|nr:unnamed protein product [Spirodela intermedia]CAA6662507.1 unnamed protein product [Spirodela intermedia]
MQSFALERSSGKKMLPTVSEGADDHREYFFQEGSVLRLCRSILVDGGAKSFALERSSGKKCFLLSARELTIIWGDTPHYWDWISVPGSRFSEVARLLDVCWLEIRGKIECGMLSQKTSYAAQAGALEMGCKNKKVLNKVQNLYWSTKIS